MKLVAGTRRCLLAARAVEGLGVVAVPLPCFSRLRLSHCRRATVARAEVVGGEVSKDALRVALLQLLPPSSKATSEVLLSHLPSEHPLRLRRRPPWVEVATAALLHLAPPRPKKAARAKPAAAASAISKKAAPAAVAQLARASTLPAAPSPSLRPYQSKGVQFILSRRAALLADDMGLGKTAQALAALAESRLLPAIVVCPAFLKLNWVREAAVWLPGAAVHLVKPQSKLPWPAADLHVVNYDILQRHTESLMELRARALVLDESQYIKNPAAQRTDAALALSKEALRQGAHVLLLTGTPVLNRPVELVTQMEALGVTLAGLSSFSFKERYCGPATITVKGRTIKTYDGASNVDELQSLLSSAPWFLRRLKRDVLADLPPKLYALTVVELSDADMAKYKLKRAELAEAVKKAKERGVESDNAKMGLMAGMRSLVAELKLPAVLKWVGAWLEANPTGKLIVFAWHVSMVNGVAKATGGLRIRGSDSTEQRQTAVDAFQSPAGPRVIACNIHAAGVGLTLTAATAVCFAEQAWSPAVNTQAEDRAHRIGQTETVTVHSIVAEGTIDVVVEMVLGNKRRVVTGAVDGHETPVQDAVMRHLELE